MARMLGNIISEAVMDDKLGGGEIILYYRPPTTKERVEYTNLGFRRQAGKLVINKGETRMDYGLKIITGFRFGDFLDAKGKPFASEPEHKDYRADWKDLLMDGGQDLVDLLAARVFDMSCSIATPVPDKVLAETAGKAAPPLPEDEAEDISGNS